MAAARPRAFLLKPGHLERDEAGNILDARSSVTLILTQSRNIVVDTATEGEEELIVGELAALGLSPEEVDLVINTHDHPDHSGNNGLFPRARILSGEGVGRLKEGDHVASGVWIMETPGHSLDSISVVCESSRRTVMAGDAIPLMGNYLRWVPPRLHVDRELAMRSMARIVEVADLVVPGHDSPFLVRERVRVTDLG
ncbi:MBL fold metallo-hydrolase [Methanocrinis sp.]|uniref:MBL fold metallo-hydrolase n=1 Tax=Methanocrinis sp. TaxID=3101522 RepID=UPI003D14EFA2